MKFKQLFKIVLLFIATLYFSHIAYGQKYKDMMDNNAINFYDVVKEAEAYFKTIDINSKGSGYKQFRRWANNNEYKYYPSGNRLIVDPEFAAKAYRKNISNKKKQFNKSNTIGWREIGPFTINKITEHYSAGIGRIEDFHVDSINSRNIYICSRSGGLWKTTDEGTTWLATRSDTLPTSGVNSITVDPLNFNHVYIAGQAAKNNYSFGIYESVNGGRSFTETRFNPTNLGLGGLGSNFKIYTIRHHPTISNLLLVGTSNGLYKTTDNFNTWTLVLNSIPRQVAFHPTNAGIIYTIERNSVYVSNDTGRTFSTTTIAANNNASSKIAVTAAAPDNVYIISSAGLFSSVNSGASFTFVSNSFNSITDIGTDGFAVNSNNSQNLLIGSLNVANSTDGGASFMKKTEWYLGGILNGAGTYEQNYFNSTAYIHADLRIAKSINGVFYVGTDGGLAKSTDGGATWQNLTKTNTPAIRENYKLGVSQSNNNIAICGSQDNGTSIKKPTEWVEAFGADGMEGIILPLNPDYMIGSYQYGGRIITSDAGTSFTRSSTNSTEGAWESPLAYDPNDHFKVYDFRNGVYNSTDFGINYNYVGIPSFLNSHPNEYAWQISSAEIAQNNSNVIVVSAGSEIEKSTNGGVSFLNIKNNLPNHLIQDIVLNPKNDNDIIVVNASYQNNGEKVYRSTDGGVSWSNITFNISDVPVHTVVIDHSNNPKIYIGTEVGVYYMPLNGNSWTLYNEGLPNVAIEELEINNGANTIKAATWGRGLWEYDLIGRKTYPSIVSTSITNPPTLDLPIQGSRQFVTSKINYSGTLTNAIVKYSINNQLFNNTISMSNTTGNTWVSNQALPNSTVIGDKVFFKVYAIGSNSDTSETYKFMYQVRNLSICNDFTAIALATNTCSLSNGSATVSATDGAEPYIYSWSNSQTTAKITGLATGSYSVTVMDANQCTTVARASITGSSSPLTNPSGNNVSCYGGANGKANANTITGGTAPYSYLWSNQQTTVNITGLAAGTYSVTVRDANQCTATGQYVVTQPQSALTANVIATPSPSGQTKGTATVNATGGTPAYSYLWNNQSDLQTIINLAIGPYYVTVSDANQCTTTAESSVIINSVANAEIFNLTLGPNPSSNQINLYFSKPIQWNCELTIYSLNGSKLLSEDILANTARHILDVSSLSKGIYNLVLLNPKGNFINIQFIK